MLILGKQVKNGYKISKRVQDFEIFFISNPGNLHCYSAKYQYFDKSVYVLVPTSPS